MNEDFYDDEFYDEHDQWDDDPQKELEVARIISAVAHAQAIKASKDDPDTLSNLVRVGLYINLLEANLEALFLVARIEASS